MKLYVSWYSLSWTQALRVQLDVARVKVTLSLRDALLLWMQRVSAVPLQVAIQGTIPYAFVSALTANWELYIGV